ncbi:hypothetical protein [Pseudooceanicola nanhaiensis]|nr:hypothetical protein [Pseudooceanicola nanhaiensis]
MTKQEIETKRFQNTRRRRRAQALELLIGLAVMAWIVGTLGVAA